MRFKRPIFFLRESDTFAEEAPVILRNCPVFKARHRQISVGSCFRKMPLVILPRDQDEKEIKEEGIVLCFIYL